MPIADRKLRVFLCHAKEDKPIVRELYQRLSSEDWIDPWLDEEKLLPGQDWNMEIETAVESARAVIVCLSKNSVSKEGYVQKEISKVLDISAQMPEGTIFIIPLRLEECQSPRRLNKWQWLDYFPVERKDIAYQRLMTSLRSRANVIGIQSNLQDTSVELPKPKSNDTASGSAKSSIRKLKTSYLSKSDQNEKIGLAVQLAKFGDVEFAIQSLKEIAILGGYPYLIPDHVQERATKELGEIGFPAIPALREILDQCKKFEARLSACDALLRLNDIDYACKGIEILYLVIQHVQGIDLAEVAIKINLRKTAIAALTNALNYIKSPHKYKVDYLWERGKIAGLLGKCEAKQELIEYLDYLPPSKAFEELIKLDCSEIVLDRLKIIVYKKLGIDSDPQPQPKKDSGGNAFTKIARKIGVIPSSQSLPVTNRESPNAFQNNDQFFFNGIVKLLALIGEQSRSLLILIAKQNKVVDVEANDLYRYFYDLALVLMKFEEIEEAKRILEKILDSRSDYNVKAAQELIKLGEIEKPFSVLLGLTGRLNKEEVRLAAAQCLFEAKNTQSVEVLKELSEYGSSEKVRKQASKLLAG